MPRKLKLLAASDGIVGTPGDDFLDGGSGDQTIAGGAGRDTFVLRSGGGHDVVTDFNPSEDRVLFDIGHAYSDILYFGQLHDNLTFDNGYGTASFTVTAADVNADGVTDTLITASTGDSIALLNIAPDSLYGWSLMGG